MDELSCTFLKLLRLGTYEFADERESKTARAAGDEVGRHGS